MSRANKTDPFALPPDPDLHDLFKSWARKVVLQARTATVGSVVTYNAATQTANVIVDILEIARVAEVPEPVPRPPIALTNVPVHIYGDGTGINYLSMPIVPGSTGMLIVSDRSLATWLNRTGPVPVDPVEWFTHRLASAVFVPGLTDNLHRISTPTALGGPVLEGPQIYLGREAVAAGLSAAIAENLITAIDATMAALVAAGAGAGYAGAGAAQAAWNAAKNAIASSKVKVSP